MLLNILIPFYQIPALIGVLKMILDRFERDSNSELPPKFKKSQNYSVSLLFTLLNFQRLNYYHFHKVVRDYITRPIHNFIVRDILFYFH